MDLYFYFQKFLFQGYYILLQTFVIVYFWKIMYSEYYKVLRLCCNTKLPGPCSCSVRVRARVLRNSVQVEMFVARDSERVQHSQWGQAGGLWGGRPASAPDQPHQEPPRASVRHREASPAGDIGTEVRHLSFLDRLSFQDKIQYPIRA